MFPLIKQLDLSNDVSIYFSESDCITGKGYFIGKKTEIILTFLKFFIS